MNPKLTPEAVEAFARKLNHAAGGIEVPLPQVFATTDEKGLIVASCRCVGVEATLRFGTHDLPEQVVRQTLGAWFNRLLNRLELTP